jgi:hypothetical protein
MADPAELEGDPNGLAANPPEPEPLDVDDWDGVAELWVAAVDVDSWTPLSVVELVDGVGSSSSSAAVVVVVVEDDGALAVVAGLGFVVGFGVCVASAVVLLNVVGDESLPM